jgi:bacterioferritin-associated ferredoxin
MYICICHGISKTEIRRLISQGALTLPALQQRCGAGTNCGSCLSKLKAMLNKDSSAHNDESRQAAGNKLPKKR